MAELVDAAGLGPVGRKPLEVQVLSSAFGFVVQGDPFHRDARGDNRRMSIALVLGLTTGSLAAAALSIAYALAHR